MVGMGFGFWVLGLSCARQCQSGHVPSEGVLETNTELWGPLLIIFKPWVLMVK